MKNSCINFKGSANFGSELISTVSNDLVIRAPETNSIIKFQKLSCRWFLHIYNHWFSSRVPNSLTLSGVLQNLITSLIGVSKYSDNLKRNPLGVSHSNFSAYSLNNFALGTSLSTVDGKVGSFENSGLSNFTISLHIIQK